MKIKKKAKLVLFQSPLMYETNVVLGNHCCRLYRKKSNSIQICDYSIMKKFCFGWGEFGFEVPGEKGARGPLKWVCNF